MGNSPTIEFLPSPINGDNPWELCGILYHECTEAARKVEQTLDMEIGRLLDILALLGYSNATLHHIENISFSINYYQ
jgi:hypothetical protein